MDRLFMQGIWKGEGELGDVKSGVMFALTYLKGED